MLPERPVSAVSAETMAATTAATAETAAATIVATAVTAETAAHPALAATTTSAARDRRDPSPVFVRPEKPEKGARNNVNA